MKKLLLVLIVLAGLVLPGMAQNFAEDNNPVQTTENDSIDEIVKSALLNFAVYKKYDTEPMNELKKSLKNKDAWASISNPTVQTVVNFTVTHTHDISFIDFLLIKGMPSSEYDRYIKCTEARIEEINNLLKMADSLVGEGKMPNYFEEDYQTAQDILTLFAEAKEEAMRKQAEIVDHNVRIWLQYISEGQTQVPAEEMKPLNP